MSVKIKRLGLLTWQFELDGWHAVAFLSAFGALWGGLVAWIILVAAT